MSGTTNPIPNSDIIGYEGAVGQEKALHKTHFSVPEKTWKSAEESKWVRVGPGRYRLVKDVSDGLLPDKLTTGYV